MVIQLKSSFTQLLSTFPSRVKNGGNRLRRVVTQRCLQTARQNAQSGDKAPPLLQLHKLPPTVAYIHLPFCRKRCHYCNFPIIALGSSIADTASEIDPRISSYVELLIREINATKVSSSNSPPLETVFFGGGTPSLVPPSSVSLILDALSSRFGVCEDAEVSMEMDPGTFDEVVMKDLMSLGVNRVSLGVQAFQDELLKVCGRAHGVEEIRGAIEIVKSCGVENWSVDLISSLPNQTLSMWKESLLRTIEAQPTHVSVYDLQIEEDTKFGVLYTPGELPLPSENQSAEFYRMASAMLRKAGYEHYEVSSYSQNGYRCKHNCTYWKNRPFYAFGLGSASYIDGLRFSRPKRLKEYTTYVQDLGNGIPNSSIKDGIIDAKDLAMDVVMLSLRTSDGLDLRAFREAFGDSLMLSVCEVYRPHIESGHVICLDERRRYVTADEFMCSLSNELIRNEKLGFLRLGDPDGFLLSNELISLAFSVVSP